MGKDNDNDWSDFGGRCEFKDRCDPINTATREFYEETLGAVLTIQECIPLMSDTQKIISAYALVPATATKTTTTTTTTAVVASSAR